MIIKTLFALLFNAHFHCIYLLNSASDEQIFVLCIQILQVVAVRTHNLMYLFCFEGLRLLLLLSLSLASL